MYFPKEEYESRWRKVEEELERRGHETVAIWQRTGGSYDRAGDVWYLTNYASHSSGQEPSAGAWPVGRSFAALLMRKGAEPELHIAEPVSTVDRDYVAVENIVGHDDLGTGLGRRLKELGIERSAYVGDNFLPIELHRRLTDAAPEVEWVPEESLLWQIMSHKSERELALYRELGPLAAKALTTFMHALIRGERQCDAAAEAASIIIRGGGGFQRVACHTGPKSAFAMWDYPLYGYSREAAKPGEMVRAWVYGPLLEGYWIDPGRCSVAGPKPSPEQRRLIESTVELVEEIIGAIRPGVTPREAGVVGDEFIRRAGLSDSSGGSIWDLYGHGIGTFWLGPNIPAYGAATFEDDKSWWDVDRPFHSGQVYTVETFVEEPGVGTATFEEVMIIGDDGVERITPTPMLFW